MQIYIMPDGSKRQYEVAPEGAVPFNPTPKKEVKTEEKTVEEPKTKTITPRNKALKGSKKK